MFERYKRAEVAACVVTFQTTTPMMLMAKRIAGGSIVLMDAEKISLDPAVFEQKTIPQLRRLSDQHFTVVVDEQSGELATAAGGVCVQLMSQAANEDAPIIVQAYELYRELSNTRKLVLPSKNTGAYQVPPSLVNVTFSGQTGKQYQINVGDLRTEQHLALLAVYACMKPQMNQLQYQKQFMAEMARGQQRPAAAPGEYARGMSAVGYADRVASDKAPKSMAGTVIDENSWIL